MIKRWFLLLLVNLCCGVFSIACAAPDSDSQKTDLRDTTDFSASTARQANAAFDAQRAFAALKKQCEFGPRPPGSAAHRETQNYLFTELQKYANSVELQPLVYKTKTDTLHLNNILAEFGPGVPTRYWEGAERRDDATRGTLGHTSPSPITTQNRKIRINRFSVPTMVLQALLSSLKLPEFLKNTHRRGELLLCFSMARITAEPSTICLSVPGFLPKILENGSQTTASC